MTLSPGWTGFAAQHRCGQTLLYNGAPVYLSIETSGGWTQRVMLVTELRNGAPPIPDDAELTCPCGRLTPGRTAGEARQHFERECRRWDRENPPMPVATGARR